MPTQQEPFRVLQDGEAVHAAQRAAARRKRLTRRDAGAAGGLRSRTPAGGRTAHYLRYHDAPCAGGCIAAFGNRMNMATISNANLQVSHDHTKKTARVIVTAMVNFSAYELSEIRQGLRFKLRCRLWGSDSGLTGADDALYAFPSKYFPDSTPSASEKAVFDVTLGEGVLDEDIGTDEVYGRLTLINLYTLTRVSKRTNEVAHNF